VIDFAREQRAGPHIRFAPLIDIVFLLLIFFMLSTSFVEDRQLDLGLTEPVRGAAEPDPEAIPPEPLLVRVDHDGPIRLNGLVLTIDELDDELRGRLAGGSMPTVVLRAEPTVPAQRLVSVIGVIREAGIDDLDIGPTKF